MNNTSAVATPPLPFMTNYTTFMKIIFHVLIVIQVFGLTSNAINILVFIKMGMRDNVTIIFLVLSCSDFIYLLTRLPETLIDLIDQVIPAYPWQFDLEILNILSYYFTLLFYEYSAFVSAFLGVLRCLSVAKPLLLRSMFTKTRTVRILILLFLLAFALRLPLLTSFRLVWIRHPDNDTFLTFSFLSINEPINDFNSIVNKNIIAWLTMAIVATCAIVLSINLKTASKFRQAVASTKEVPAYTKYPDVMESSQEEEVTSKLSARDRQVIKSVILVCVIFVFSQLPNQMLSMGQLLEPEFYARRRYAYLFYISANINVLCTMVNASVNIFVYLAYNSRYREQFRSICHI